MRLHAKIKKFRLRVVVSGYSQLVITNYKMT